MDIAGILTTIVVGALSGFLGSRWHERAQNADKRLAVATAILSELRSGELALRRLIDSPRPAESTIRPPAAMLEKYSDGFLLFTPPTIRLLTTYYGLLNEIRVAKEDMEGLGVSERGHHFIRVKCIAAATLIPGIKRALEAVGGELEDTGYGVYTAPELPTLPAPAFDQPALGKGQTYLSDRAG